jgi:peptidyl-prolyl cis-trans isomerase A (cyclophilin A)
MGGAMWTRLPLIVLALMLAFAQRASPQSKKPGTYARFDTSMGSFECELFEKQTPVAVANFTGLAQGTKEWLTPKGEMLKRPFYDGLVFHRVIQGFAIQTGNASRTETFNSIVPFQDEIVPSLRFDRPGLLAMANNGPNTNRTQVFVTVAAAPHLNGKHTIFGRVIEGLEVVKRIGEVRTLGGRPVQDVTLQKVTISRVGRSSK